MVRGGKGVRCGGYMPGGGQGERWRLGGWEGWWRCCGGGERWLRGRRGSRLVGQGGILGR